MDEEDGYVDFKDSLQRLDDYCILRKLGGGSFGEVYEVLKYHSYGKDSEVRKLSFTYLNRNHMH